jgi:hypothetical protein
LFTLINVEQPKAETCVEIYLGVHARIPVTDPVLVEIEVGQLIELYFRISNFMRIDSAVFGSFLV